MSKNLLLKIIAITTISTIALSLFTALFLLSSYLFFIPYFIKNDKLISKGENFINQYLNCEFKIKKPDLITGLNTQIGFNVENLSLVKNQKQLISLKDFSISIDYKNIFKHNIKLNSLIAKELDVDVNELQKLKIKEFKQEENKKSDWSLDFYNSNINLKNSNIIFLQPNKAKLDIKISNVKLKINENNKILSLNLNGKISKKDKTYVSFNSNINDEIKILNDNSVIISNLKILLNNSDLFLNGKIKDEKNIDVNLKSNSFLVEDIFKIINSDFIIPDGEKLLSVLIQPKGKVTFNINGKNNILSGKINLINAKAKIKDLVNLPLSIQKGEIAISKDKIDLKDFKGYWGKNKNNKLDINGDIKDYYKSFDTNIVILTTISNEFYTNHFKKLSNIHLYSTQPTWTKIYYKSKNNIMDIIALGLVPKGVEYGVVGQNATLTNYDRGLLGNFHIENNKLFIKEINYYIANQLTKGEKAQPILAFSGKMDLTGKIDEIGFKFTKEMPCEFLNLFAGPKTFKKGTFKGSMNVVYKNNIPILNADMKINKTLIPSQRIFLKEAALTTTNNLISMSAKGGFKKIKFDFMAKIKNELKTPIIVQNLILNIEEIDVEKFLTSINSDHLGNQNIETINSENDIKDDDFMIDSNLIKMIQIKDADFSIKKGKYKELTFGNVQAELTLDENGIINIQSNKFDIADGTSSLKVYLDLCKLVYYIRLGVKEVDSDLMSKVLLNLDKEISGRASGLIELNSDKSMKMNGRIRFAVKNGIIGKIGIVEYLLKIASIFRNPIIMINPGTIIDIISIPEGKFEKITGDMQIKNNVVNKINIVSTSKTLSALIKGRFDMEQHDASLRIYTRFSNSKFATLSFLRKISLDYLANKVNMNSRNDANYYSSELEELPQINVPDEKSQVFLTTVEGDIEHNNYLSSLKRIK